MVGGGWRKRRQGWEQLLTPAIASQTALIRRSTCSDLNSLGRRR